MLATLLDKALIVSRARLSSVFAVLKTEAAAAAASAAGVSSACYKSSCFLSVSVSPFNEDITASWSTASFARSASSRVTVS